MLNTIKKLKLSRWDTNLSLLAFCLFMILANMESAAVNTGLFDVKNGQYNDYYENQKIRLLNALAFNLDVILSVFLFLRIFLIQKNSLYRVIINPLLASGIFLIWYELYFGSTFYYGEVRDKQILPLCVNNFGILGSIIFLATILKDTEFRIIKIRTNQYPWTISLFLNIASAYLTKDWLDF